MDTMESSQFYRSLGVLFPVVPAQVGVSGAEQVLCSGTVTVAQLVTVVLGLISMYFILKGMVRMMIGLDVIGKPEHVGNDGRRRTDKVDPYGRQKARGGVYSWVAALLPVLVPVFLSVVGIDVASCLL